MNYTITLSKEQLQLLMRTCEIQSRLLIGQTDRLEDIFEEAIAKHKYDYKNNPDYWRSEEYQADQDWIKKTMEELHKKCWQQAINQFFGVHYSPESDSLIDFVEVARHQLWKDTEGEKSTMTNDAFPAHHWNKKENLIKIIKHFEKL